MQHLEENVQESDAVLDLSYYRFSDRWSLIGVSELSFNPLFFIDMQSVSNCRRLLADSSGYPLLHCTWSIDYL